MIICSISTDACDYKKSLKRFEWARELYKILFYGVIELGGSWLIRNRMHDE